MENTIGLVMTGGGARGAYQAGVLKRIGEIKRVQTHGNPFPIIGGSSAGAINGSAIAAGSDNIALATKLLAQGWSDIRPSDVFRCDVLSQAHNSLTWILDLSFGALLGGGNARSLLDATPLRRFLSDHIRYERINNNIKRGHLYALAISATNYNSGKSYLFIQGKKGHPMWNRSRRVTLSTNITVDHVCASAAIPLVFQPVKLKTARGTAFFGDGCVRLQQPLSPVIRLGAEKVLAIGVRCENLEPQKESADQRDPSLAQIMGVLFDVMFLDHLAVSLALNGDSAGAVEQLQKAIVVDPDSVEYRFNLAYVLESRGEFESAIQPLESAVALSRKKDWRCLAELAKVYARTGRRAQALESVRAALELALKQNNDHAAHALQQALDQYEREGAAAKTN